MSVAPRVSVVIPAYNCARHVGEAIDSVLAQDFTDYEIVVVDDGSTDDTRARVQAYGERVRIVAQPNAGAAAARNHGVRVARGALIAFLDGDDVWLPGKLGAQVVVADAARAPLVVSGGFAFWPPDAHGRYAPPATFASTASWSDVAPAGSGDLYTRLLLDSVVCIITTLMPRSLYLSLGGQDEALRTGEDYDLWLRAARCCRFTQLARLTALYRLHAEGTTRVPRAVNNEYAVLRNAIARFGTRGADGSEVDAAALRRRFAKLCFDHGYLHLRRGDPAVAARSLLESMRHSGVRPRTAALAALASAKCVTRFARRS